MKNKINLFIINKEYLEFMTKMGIKGIKDFKYGIITNIDNTMYFIPIDLTKNFNDKNILNNLQFDSMLPIENSEHFVIEQDIKNCLNVADKNTKEFHNLIKLKELLEIWNENINLICKASEDAYWNIVNS